MNSVRIVEFERATLLIRC